MLGHAAQREGPGFHPQQHTYTYTHAHARAHTQATILYSSSRGRTKNSVCVPPCPSILKEIKVTSGLQLAT